MYTVVTSLAPSFMISNNLIFFILAGNKDSHKILDGFEIQQDRNRDYGQSCMPLSVWKN